MGASCRARPSCPISAHTSPGRPPPRRRSAASTAAARAARDSVTQARAGRLQRCRRGVKQIQLSGRRSAQLLDPHTDPPQPAPHGPGRHVEPLGDDAITPTAAPSTQRGRDDLDTMRPPRGAPRRQQHMGPPTPHATRPPWRQLHPAPAQQRHHPRPRMRPRRQPAHPARRAAQLPRSQVGAHLIGVQEQQHRRRHLRSWWQGFPMSRRRDRGSSCCTLADR